MLVGLDKLLKSRNQNLENNSAAISKEELWQQLEEIPAACIGPVTAAKAEEYGLNVKITAAEYTIEGLFAAISAYYS
ncbi:uroporphyrinogen-III synthase [Halanaerobium saccharolyticum]|nr:uroporphyrinogen-III synthase [Halanaerobium saccharolyticum]